MMSDQNEQMSVDEMRAVAAAALSENTAPVELGDGADDDFLDAESAERNYSYSMRILGENATRVHAQFASCYHKGKEIFIPWTNINSITKRTTCNGYVVHWVWTKTPVYST